MSGQKIYVIGIERVAKFTKRDFLSCAVYCLDIEIDFQLAIRDSMLAAILKAQKKPLVVEEVPKPVCGKGELLIKVHACGVCRTDLHILDGDLTPPKLPLILGHEIVGEVVEVGSDVSRFHVGERVGISWLAQSCGTCEYCQSERENLCDEAQFTGYHRDGGFAEYTTCLADFAVALPATHSSESMAPFLCAGLIGYRSYQMAFAEKTLGFYGFGSAAHLLLPLAISQGKQVYVFTRVSDIEGQGEALRLGATWSGDSTMKPPVFLDAVILFAAVGDLVPRGLKVLKKGGRCICGEIHMSDIPSFPYADLWGEKRIQSVANLTRRDAVDFFQLLPKVNIHPVVSTYSLENINQAIEDLRKGKVQGSAVIQMVPKSPRLGTMNR